MSHCTTYQHAETRRMSHAKDIYALCKKIADGHLVGIVTLVDNNSEQQLAAARDALMVANEALTSAHDALAALNLDEQETEGTCNV